MANRQQLIARAAELGCFPDPQDRSDQQLTDAIAAEEAAIAWMERFDALPDEQSQQAAVHRLARAFDRARE